jgi:hypothetical protein
MRLVISTSICQREFGKDVVPDQHVDSLRRSTSIDLASIIKGENLPSGTHLLKVYATSPVVLEGLFICWLSQKRRSFCSFIAIKKIVLVPM